MLKMYSATNSEMKSCNKGVLVLYLLVSGMTLATKQKQTEENFKTHKKNNN